MGWQNRKLQGYREAAFEIQGLGQEMLRHGMHMFLGSTSKKYWNPRVGDGYRVQ